jgi:hypothetical protein
MENTLIDPTTFTVEMQRAMGMWPPSDCIGVAIAPELRRMGREIDVIDLGVGKGESIVYLIENVPNIKTMYGLVHENDHDEIIGKNLNGLSKVNQMYKGEEVDVLLITMTPTTSGKTLEQYYEKLRVGGIIVGDQHTSEATRIALAEFRQKNKITININVIKKEFWFWKKR